MATQAPSATTVGQRQHHGRGIDSLLPDQLEHLNAGLGLRPLGNLNAAAYADRLETLQRLVDVLAENDDGVHDIMDNRPDQYIHLAAAFGYKSFGTLNQVGRIEQAAAIQRKIGDLAR